MRIGEILRQRKTFSFEVFPPKAEQPIEPVMETLERLYMYKPDFISCTYGAGGTNMGRQTEILSAIRTSGKTEPLAHFTCIGHTRESVRQSFAEYAALGVTNYLALRGDLPDGWTGTRGDFSHADGLLRYMKTLYPDVCAAAACYPEKHIAAESLDKDISYLSVKQDCGAEFLMAQLCHDADAFSRFIERIRKAGVQLPVIAGIMPVLKKDAIIRMTLSNGCSIPAELAAIIGKYGEDPEDFKKAGKEYTVKQIFRFRNAGAGGLHFYTLNRNAEVGDIIEASGLRSAMRDEA